jgi:DNA-binding NarL/FixJ family response regulator
LIVDDHEVVRQGVRTIIESRTNWEVCGEAATGAEAIAAAKTLAPDVVILDISMPTMGGLEALEQIRKLGLSTRVLIFTMHDSRRLAHDVREKGGQGYVVKSQAGRDLVRAIEHLLGGDTFFRDDAALDPGRGGQSNSSVVFFAGVDLSWA